MTILAPQDSTAAVTTSETYASSQMPDAQSAPRQQLTVARVLSWLPYNATEAQKDSLTRVYFPIKRLTNIKADGTEGGLPNITVTEKQTPTIATYRENFFAQSPYFKEEIPYKPEGIAGDPLPYRLRTDSLVSSLILLSFFLAVYTLARSHSYITRQLKEFFFVRESENMFTPAAETRMQGEVFLIFQTCFVLAILFFKYTQNELTFVFNQISPYLLLATNIGIFLCYYVSKFGLYALINNIFFERRQTAYWRHTFIFTIWGEAMLLFPVILLVVYFNILFSAMSILVIAIVSLVLMVRLYKSYAIFFRYRFGYVHFILYFCALELAPLLILWRVLIYGSKYLTVNF